MMDASGAADPAADEVPTEAHLLPVEQPPRRSGLPEAAREERGRKGRIVFFVLMALLMQLTFVISYVGGMHSPQPPHRMKIAVVAPADAVGRLQKEIDTAGPYFRLRPVADAAAATDAIKKRTVFGAYAPNPAGTDTVLVSSAEGPPAAQLIEAVFERVAAAQQRQATVTDVVPARNTDRESLVPFYLTVAWTVGGYLASTLVGLMGGMTSRTPRLAAERLGLFAGYSILGGVGGTVIVKNVMGFIGGDWWTLAFLGSMVVFAVSVFANGLQSLLGLIGTGVVIGLFVIFGNPSAGGPWPRDMMPPFWRTIGPWLPNYQGTWAARGIGYFQSHGFSTAMWVLVIYAVIGIVLSLGLAGRDNPVLKLSEH